MGLKDLRSRPSYVKTKEYFVFDQSDSSNNTIASSTFSRVGLLDSMVLCCMGDFSDSDSSSDSDDDGGSDTDDGSEVDFDIFQVKCRQRENSRNVTFSGRHCSKRRRVGFGRRWRRQRKQRRQTSLRLVFGRREPKCRCHGFFL